MKKFYGVFAAMLLVFGLAGVAGAIPMTWTDMIDWKPDKYINHNKSYHYYHDISDDGFGGFGSGDWVTHYSLTVDLYDDGDGGKEKAYVDVLGFGAGGYNFSYTSKTYGWSFFGDTRS